MQLRTVGYLITFHSLQRDLTVNKLRRAFTLIEVIVVLSCIGVLLALVIPAVQAAREASRRSVCASHLRQLGIGLSGHQAVRSHFPAAILSNGVTSTGRPFALPDPISIHGQLLPFLDDTSIWNSMNIPGALQRYETTFSLYYSNATAASRSIEIFLCPSDNAAVFNHCSYRGNVGSKPYMHDGTSWPGGGGPFPGLNATRASDILDGLSNTAAVSERLIGSFAKHGDFVRDVWLTDVGRIAPVSSATLMASICSSYTSGSAEFLTSSGERWIMGGYENTLYNHVQTPNVAHIDCSADGSTLGGRISGAAISARSFHSNGVNVLFLDGSVRFVTRTIQPSVWVAIGTRAGGEVLTEY